MAKIRTLAILTAIHLRVWAFNFLDSQYIFNQANYKEEQTEEAKSISWTICTKINKTWGKRMQEEMKTRMLPLNDIFLLFNGLS